MGGWRRFFLLALLALLETLSLGAATAMDASRAGYSSGPVSPSPPDEVVVTEGAEGTTVVLSRGQTLAIVLESNPSTGYRWDVAQAEPPVLRPLDVPLFRQRSPHLGAPEEQTLRFTAVQPGEGWLRLVYHRPWEEVPPAREFRLRVVVREGGPVPQGGGTPRPLRPMRLTLPRTPQTVPAIREQSEPEAVDGWVTLLEDGFEGDFPGPWDIADANGPAGGEYHWGKRDCRPYDGSYSVWAPGDGEDGEALSCGADYPDDSLSWMVYGPFSLADATAAEMDFWLWVSSEWGYDLLFWGASVDGSEFYGEAFSGESFEWWEVLFDLSDVYVLGNLLGEPEVWVAFVWVSDEDTTYPEGAYVDDATCSCARPWARPRRRRRHPRRRQARLGGSHPPSTGGCRRGACPLRGTRGHAARAGPSARWALWRETSRSRTGCCGISQSSTWCRATWRGGAAMAGPGPTTTTGTRCPRASRKPAPSPRETSPTRLRTSRAILPIRTPPASVPGALWGVLSGCQIRRPSRGRSWSTVQWPQRCALGP